MLSRRHGLINHYFPRWQQFFLLMFLSGIPLAEDRYDKRFGSDAEYVQYKLTTSPLVPMPPALYAVLPDLFKTCLFCEFPRYSRHFAVKQNINGDEQA